MSEAPTEQPIRPAATVLVLRDQPGGLEVFMLRRTSLAVFGGGMYVFPGGKVDETDGSPEVAAIRECFEESGILLARDRDGRPVDPGHPVFAHREAVHDGSVSIAELLTSHGLVPDIDALSWIARWVTPRAEMPRRFDTRFFVTAMPAGQDSRHDDTETVASEWIRPADAVARWESQQMSMFPPTVHQLRFIAAHHSVDEAIAAARAVGTPPCIEPKLIPGTFTVVLPGEPGYDEMPG